MKDNQIANFSTTLPKATKELLERFCKARGLRMNHVIEKALLEFIEDEMDKALIDDRELEDLVPWKSHN